MFERKIFLFFKGQKMHPTCLKDEVLAYKTKALQAFLDCISVSNQNLGVLACHANKVTINNVQNLFKQNDQILSLHMKYMQSLLEERQKPPHKLYGQRSVNEKKNGEKSKMSGPASLNSLYIIYVNML